MISLLPTSTSEGTVQVFSLAQRLQRIMRSGLLQAGLSNTALRGLTLASRAAFIVFFARFLSPAELGIYSLFAVTIGLVQYVLGFEFYAFTTRELLARPQSDWAPMLRDQAVFHLIVYLPVLPLLSLLFFAGILPWTQLIWFYALLVLEHLDQEMYRVLLTASRSVMANLIQFVRSGAWICVFIGLAVANPSSRGLNTVWACWLGGLLLSFGLGAWSMRFLQWKEVLRIPVNVQWLRRGVRVSARLLTAALALWGITTIDRYYLERYRGPELVGVYSFYMSIGSAMVVFVEAGIVAPLHPQLVGAYHRGPVEFRRVFRNFRNLMFATSVALPVMAILCIHPVLRLVNRPIYDAHINIFWIVMAFAVVSMLSRPPSYAIFARSLDFHFTASAVLGLAIAALLNTLLTPAYGPLGTAISTLSAVSAVAAWRVIVAWRSNARINISSPCVIA